MNRHLHKLLMYHEIHHLHRQGYSISYIADYLLLNWRTVNKYLTMSEQDYETFLETQSRRKRQLTPYELFVHTKLKAHPETCASQMHDWLKEHYSDFPPVAPKTVYNFVMWVRQKYHIPKQIVLRNYMVVEEVPYGKQAQVDFGEYTMRCGSGKRKKVYFFTMVLSRSRYKYVYFSEVPFTTSIAVAAHQKAFSWFKGIPKELVYDQDKVFLHDENKGDLLLTTGFNRYVSHCNFDIYFCRKADPQTKGKVENVVKYVKQNFLYNRTFYDIETLNDQALAWLGRTANTMPHGKTKQARIDQWLIERNYLSNYIAQPQQAEPAYYTIRKDNTISYKSNLYSLPYGTWSPKNKKVVVTQQQDILVVSKPSGEEICRHRLCLQRGKTIINNNHKRDSSTKIDRLLVEQAALFKNPERTLKWFKVIRKQKPRYIRDQVSAVMQAFNTYGTEIIEPTLTYCISHHIYSAADFTAIAGKYQQEIAKDKDAPMSKTIKPLPDAHKHLREIEPLTSNINDYQDFMNN